MLKFPNGAARPCGNWEKVSSLPTVGIEPGTSYFESWSVPSVSRSLKAVFAMRINAIYLLTLLKALPKETANRLF